MKTIIKFGAQLFPDRRFVVQSNDKSYIVSLAGPVQAAVLAAALLAVTSTAAVTYRSIEAQRQVVRERAAVIADLKAELADVRQQAAAAEQTLQQLAVLAQPETSAAPADLSAASTTAADSTIPPDPTVLGEKINDRIEQLEQQLQALNTQKTTLANDRERLAAEKGKLQKSVGELKLAKDQEKEKTEAVAKAVESATAERDRLRQRVTELEKKLQKLSLAAEARKSLLARNKTTDHVVADAVEVPASAMGAEANAAPSDGSDAANESEEAEEEAPAVANLPSGGFNLDKYLAQYGLGVAHQGAAMGGPFVALGSVKIAGRGLTPEAAAVLRSVPLTAPLPSYRLESGFGVRVDPIRHRRSVHTGLDLSAPYQSPVYSTSGGTVVFAGYSGAYGKMVEIDHGHGFHTRYAHLNRLMVNAGQHVSEHAEIGLLGSTGRSTGPHVHYEVLVNGVQQNPLPFLNAGQGMIVKTGE